jgi:hypothetical protein
VQERHDQRGIAGQNLVADAEVVEARDEFPEVMWLKTVTRNAPYSRGPLELGIPAQSSAQSRI